MTQRKIWFNIQGCLIIFCSIVFLFEVLFAQSSNDYRSKTSGNWDATGSWERFNGTTWAGATNTPSTGVGDVTILSSHDITVTAAVSVNEITVAAGGTVTVNSALAWTINNGTGVDLTINGTVTVDGTINGSSSSGGGSIDLNGTLTINSGGLVTAPQGASPSMDVNSGGVMNIAGTYSPVASSGGPIININSGGTINVTGTFSPTANQNINLNQGGSINVSGTGDFNPDGVTNFDVDGAFTMSDSATGSATRGNGGNTVTVSSSGTFTMSGSTTFGIDGIASNSFDVDSGGAVTMGPSALINGIGDFSLAAGANLSIGSTAGISAGTALTGNIQNTGGGRSFSTGANYTYAGTAAQNTGDGFPTTVNNLTISNTGGDVTLDSSLAVKGTLQVDASAVLAPAAGSVVSDSAGTLTGSGTVKVTQTGASASFNNQYTTITKTLTNLTVDYVGTSAQTVNTYTYSGLKIRPGANSITHTFAAGSFTATGDVTIGNGTNTGVSITAAANSSTLDLDGSITINSGATFVAHASNSFTIAKNFTVNAGGAFTHSDGTVTWDSTADATITGSTTFYNFTSTTATKTFKFNDGDTFTMAAGGTFTITGSSGAGNLIDLFSDNTGQKWYIKVSGSAAVTYADVRDGGCDGASLTIDVDDGSTNNGGNNESCWDFTPPERTRRVVIIDGFIVPPLRCSYCALFDGM